MTILKTFLMALMVLAASNTHAAKLYKWVDSNGAISYQDRPPPKNAKILSEQTVKSSVSDDINKNPILPKVLIYTVTDCEACEKMISMLNQSKVPHIQLPLEDDRKAQKRILQNASSIVVPTLFIDDELIQGRTPDQVRKMLKSAGFEVAEEGS